MKLLRKLRALFRKEKLDAEMSEEMRAHLDLQAAENVKRGMSADDARYAARRSFGGVEQIKEQCRDEHRWVWIEQFTQDLRFAIRSLRKTPGFAATVIATLALGIGANATIFSVVNAVLLAPLPYTNASRLVTLQETRPEAGATGQRVNVPVSPATFVDWRNEVRAFEQIAAVTFAEFAYSGGGEPEQLIGASASVSLFPMLGVTPLLGRPFTAEDDRPGAEGVVLLSHGFWQRRFGANPSVIGQPVTLAGRRYTVVGVLPPTFDGAGVAGTARGMRPEVWMPLGLVEAGAERAMPAFGVHARLKAGATLARAQAELDAIMQRLAKEFPETNATRGALVQPLAERMVGDVRSTIWMLFAAVGLVLLIACANIANLLLARATLRRGETALRAALGAGRSRLVRQFLTESLLLAVTGCVIGLIVAAASLEAFASLLPANVPRAEHIAIDGRVLAFSVIVSLLTGVIFGLAPAWSGAQTDLQTTLKAIGRSGGTGAGGARFRSALVVTQVALSIVLLVGAGLLLRSFAALSGVDPGFDPRNVISLRVALPEGKYATPAKQSAFFEQLVPQLQALPGVESAAAAIPLPFSAILNRPFTLPDQPSDPAAALAAQYNIVTPEYFGVLKIRLTQGRGFMARDRAGAPLVAVINETMARRLWPGENPVGKRLVIGMGRGAEREIVGVCADIHQRQLDSEPRLQVCVPHLQEPMRVMYLAVRGKVAAGSLLPAIRQQIAALDREQPVSDVAALSERVAASIAQRRFAMLLLAGFAGTALVLAIVGLYGVMSYLVAQRTREFGIRVALGARLGDLLQLVVGQGLKLVLAGLAAGVLAALGLTRVLGGLLFGVRPTDPATFSAVALLLALVGGLACYLPARRAAKVDPMAALRAE